MSDLKWQTVAELRESRKACEDKISYLREKVAKLESSINGQQVRLEWIDRYLYQKTPQELTIEEIEAKLGHKIIIK